MIFEKLVEKLRKIADDEIENGAEVFMEWPRRWYDGRLWRCVNDHVSRMILKRVADGSYVCLECREPVHLTFPEDQDGQL